MSDVKWTPEQSNAINAEGGTLLVSAAAGSGKTAVLVERVIRKMTREVNPCPADKLLIVTFTRAAAAQMQRKISEALSKKISEEPGSTWLRRQQSLLPLAQISTIDSFCINLVRGNFQLLDISPDFAPLDESRLSVLRDEAVTAVLERCAEETPEGYAELNSLCSSADNDSRLSEAIKKLYAVTQAYPFPEKRLEELKACFSDPQPIKSTPWGRQILKYVESGLDYAIRLIEEAVELAAQDEKVNEKYTPTLNSDSELYAGLLNTVRTESWDNIGAVFEGAAFERIKTIAKYDSEIKDRVKALRDKAKDIVTKKLSPLFSIGQEEHEKDMELMLPAVSCLVEMVKEFSAEYGALKKAENGVDFDDILHMTLGLLADRDENGEVIPSAMARELSEDFEEILIDEYQDVNEAQDLVFRLLSKDESNLFMVGDVKQSIYGFRQARPDIFIDKRDRFFPYDGEHYPATVVLGRNFRSRSGVTENVNFIFSRLMTRAVGGLEYGEADMLHYNPGAYQPHTDADAELHLIVCDKNEKSEAEVRHIINYIRSSVGTLQVKDGDGQRPAEYGDFCVLFRSMDKTSLLLEDELEKLSIPVMCDCAEDFFKAPEIRFMLSLLRVLNNPADDVALLTVMLSPVYGFTPDELAVIRADCRKGGMYSALRFAADSGNRRAAGFLESLEAMRMTASTVSVTELVRRLVDETGYLAVVSAMDNAGVRRSNLGLLELFAQKYESGGKTGLTGFLRFAEKAEASGASSPGASGGGEKANAVKITTIHKSKGLEFPVCIIASCAKQFNMDDSRKRLIISQNCGLGVDRVDSEEFTCYSTVSKTAAKLEQAEASRAEELRVLYVALTRAKEKLIITAGIEKEDDTKITKVTCSSEGRVHPFAVLNASTSLELFCYALTTRSNTISITDAANAFPIVPEELDCEFKVTMGTEQAGEETAEESEEEAEIAAELMSEIRDRLDFVYPHSALDGLPVKRVASDFSHSQDDFGFFAVSRPAFMSKKELTPAQRGTATHKFMQFCDFERAAEDIGDELDRLRSEGILSENEAAAVETDKVKRFFESEVYKRLLSAQTVWRENGFTVALPAHEVYPELSGKDEDETVLIDGVVDLAFKEGDGVVIIDYKTDRNITPEELAERYRGQLSVYRRCLSETLGLPVKETWLYSFSLGMSVRSD